MATFTEFISVHCKNLAPSLPILAKTPFDSFLVTIVIKRDDFGVGGVNLQDMFTYAQRNLKNLPSTK